MDLAHIAHDLERLTAADAVIAESYLRYAVRKTGLCVIGGVIALAAAMLFELAAFWMLEPRFGAVSAALVLGFVNCVLAGALLILAIQLPPARDLSLALEMRQTALRALHENLSLEATRARESTYPIRPIVEIISTLLVPLITTLLQRLKAERTKTELEDHA